MYAPRAVATEHPLCASLPPPSHPLALRTNPASVATLTVYRIITPSSSTSWVARRHTLQAAARARQPTEQIRTEWNSILYPSVGLRRRWGIAIEPRLTASTQRRQDQ